MDSPIWVVIPNRNGQNHLSYSLPSLFQTTFPGLQVLMVDNCSTDGSCEFVESNFPSVYVLRNSTDLGFAGGVNRGLRWALTRGARYVAVFSNDIKVVPEWLDAAMGVFEREKGVAVVGFKELAGDQLALLVPPREVQVVDVNYELPGPLYVCDGKVIKAAGLFDERFYMYGEESDLFVRLKRGGFRNVKSNFPVWHFGGGYAQRAPIRVAWFSYRNAIRFSLKNGTPREVTRTLLSLLFYASVPKILPAKKVVLFQRLKLTSREGISEEEWEAYYSRIRRLKPGSPPLTLPIYAGAILWNLLFLPETLLARHQANRLIHNLRQYHLSETGRQ